MLFPPFLLFALRCFFSACSRASLRITYPFFSPTCSARLLAFTFTIALLILQHPYMYAFVDLFVFNRSRCVRFFFCDSARYNVCA